MSVLYPAGITKYLQKIVFAIIAVFTAFSSFFGLASSASAATPAWQGQETVRSHTAIQLKPGAAFTFEIKFKNTGTQTWRNDGANFVAIATVGPEKRRSKFQHAFWNDYFRPAILLEKTVKPGETGTFRFAMQAPKEEGAYNEAFQAVAKNLAWIDGTKFTIPLTVTSKTPVAAPAAKPTGGTSAVPPSTNDYPVRDSAYAAEWINGQVYKITAQPGQKVQVKLEVKNAGKQQWNSTGTRAVSLYTVRPNYRESALYVANEGWLAKDRIKLSTPVVGAGKSTTITFMIQAPAAEGEYAENFRLAVEEYSW